MHKQSLVVDPQDRSLNILFGAQPGQGEELTRPPMVSKLTEGNTGLRWP